MNKILLTGLIALTLLSNSIFAQETIKKDSLITIQSVGNCWTKNNTLGLGDYLYLNISNLGKLIATDKNQNNPLVLYINNMPMRGILPTFIDTNKNLAVFQITRNDSSKHAWQFLYHKSHRVSVQPAEISIGTSDKGSIKGNPGIINLNLFSKLLARIMFIMFLLIVVGFIVLAKNSIIIRDGLIPGNNDKTKFSTFSLAKSQLAFWTIIILGSVGYIFVITGEMPIISGSTWILLAISIGTTAGAQIINMNTKDQIIKISNKNWFTDVLSDNDGVNIHRFQMLLWTAFLGVYFISCVYNNLDIPQLNNDLLALMGISSGTYLGLKIPEDKKTDNKDVNDKPDVPAVG